MSLSPAIAEKLHAFARRRRTLIATRGLCVGIITLLGVMSAIVLVDWLVVIKEQWIRWVMSLAGYAIVAAVVWWSCVRLLMRIPGPHELARRMEQAEPTLREDLLSAVELGVTQTDPRFDSPVFRSLLQTSVTRRVERLHAATLLPPRLIGKWVQIASVVLMVCVGLMLVPDLRFINRLTRAMMPAAPVDRVASVHVKIIAPNPAEPRVPHNDAVSVVIELSGAHADRVILETQRGGEEIVTESITMKPVGSSRQYSAAIQLGRDPVSYRVLAGDAVTRLYTIQTAPRPHVTLFNKTYHYPEYVRKDSLTVEEATGDVEALQGSTVALAMKSDQPLQSAELRIEYADKTTQVLPLDLHSPTELRGTLAIKQAGIYRVHLVAADTDFDNQFDPPYVIDTLPDALPVIELEQPTQNVELPADSELPVRLTASDDLGLKSVVQSIVINRGKPVEKILVESPGDQLQWSQPLDLYDLSLSPGDVVSLQYAAIDLAGNRSETPVRQVTILSTGFDPARLAGVEAKRKLAESLAALHTAAADYQASLVDPLRAWSSVSPDRQRQLAAQAREAGERLTGQADAAFKLTLQALAANPTGSDAADLVLTGRWTSRMRDIVLPTLVADPFDANGASESISFAVTSSANVEKSFVRMLIADEADALMRDLTTLMADQIELIAAPPVDEPEAWKRLARRGLLLTRQIELVESQAKQLAQKDRAIAGMIDQIIAQKLVPVKQTLAQAAGVNNPGRALVNPVQDIGEALLQTRKQVATIASALHRQSDKAREQIAAQAGAVHDSVTVPLLPSSVKHLKAVGILGERRRDTDAAWASDVSLARRAVQAVSERSAATSQPVAPDRVSRVQGAIHVLETGHALAAMHRLTTDLASREKWQRSESDAITRHLRDWHWVSGLITSIPDDLRAAGMNAEAGEHLIALLSRDVFKMTDSEFTSRRSTLKITPASENLEAVARDLAQARQLIAADMARARAILAAEAPNLPQTMKSLAAASRELKEKAEKLADALAEISDVDAGRELAQLREEQGRLDEKLGDLSDALAREADAQNLFTDEGRQHARDADDARAMIAKPAGEAKQELASAAQAPQAGEKSKHIDQAAAKDEKLADALDELARHWENLEAGRAEDTRAALREAEKDLDIKRDLDAQYGRMEKLAELTNKAPQEQLKALEQELAQNPAMKQELGEIARDAVRDAKGALDDAANQQGELAKDLAQAAKEADRPRDHLDPQMKQLADKAAQLANRAQAIESAAKSSSPEASQSAGDAKQSLKQASKSAAQAAQTPKEQAAAKAAQAKAMQQAMEQAAGELNKAHEQASGASEAIREAERKATTLLAIGEPTPEERQKASELLLNSQRYQKEARENAREAGLAAEEAKRLADAAKQIADDLAKATTAGSEAMKSAAGRQGPLADQAQAAAEDVARAGRHEARMENQPAAGELNKSQRDIEKASNDQIKTLGEKLAQAMKPGEASKAAADAEAALSQQAVKLQSMMQPSPESKAGKGAKGDSPKLSAAQGAPAGTKGSPSEQEAARSMARALDELDRAMNGQPGNGSANPSNSDDGHSSEQSPSNGNGSPSASQQATEALRQAAQAQAQALAEARQQGGPQAPGQGAMPGDAMAQAGQNAQGQGQGQGQGKVQPQPGQGQSGQGNSAMAGANPQPGQPGQGSTPGQGGSGAQGGTLGSADSLKNGEWGKLPPRLTRELIEGQRDEVTGEYRGAVEAYFRAIAKQAREKGGN